VARNNSAILEVMENDFYNDARVIFEKTYLIIRRVPEGPNNKFRDGFTCLARACITDTDEEFERQIADAKAFFLSAKRECYRLAIEAMRDYINTNLVRIEVIVKGYHRGFHNELDAIRGRAPWGGVGAVGK
jgi:hypothetical protein